MFRCKYIIKTLLGIRPYKHGLFHKRKHRLAMKNQCFSCGTDYNLNVRVYVGEGAGSITFRGRKT